MGAGTGAEEAGAANDEAFGAGASPPGPAKISAARNRGGCDKDGGDAVPAAATVAHSVAGADVEVAIDVAIKVAAEIAGAAGGVRGGAVITRPSDIGGKSLIGAGPGNAGGNPGRGVWSPAAARPSDAINSGSSMAVNGSGSGGRRYAGVSGATGTDSTTRRIIGSAGTGGGI